MRIVWIASLALLFTFTSCGTAEPEAETVSQEPSGSTLGNVQIEVSGNEAAMPHFRKGLLLLHSFEYSDAAEAFRQAQEQDPSFAMAYWGEAMTHHKPLWQIQDYEEGRKIMQRLGATPEERRAKAGTELERDLVGGLDVIYGEGTKAERDKAYAEYMADLYDKYPGHHEVAAFYALSLMGSVPTGRDEDVYGRSAAIAQGIIEENPQHPGALHYLIHAYDDPDHAVRALTAANRYSKVAPDAAHALHMPSHIYVAMGMWDDVVRSNIDSYSASVNRMQDKALGSSARSYHAFHWLMYGYLQQGRLEAAKEVLDSAVTYIRQDPTAGARAYFARMKSNYLVETGDWTGWAADIEVKESDLNIANQAQLLFSDAMTALKRDDLAKAESILKDYKTRVANASQLVGEDGAAMCSASGSISRNAPSRSDIEQAEAMMLELQALVADKKGQPRQAEQYFREAIDKEKSASYSYGPPAISYPTFELYGEWLLDQDRPKDALSQFEYALKRGPNRLRALQGKKRAAEMLGDESMVRDVASTIADMQREEKEGWLM